MIRSALLLAAWPTTIFAQGLAVPSNATLQTEVIEEQGLYLLPTAAYANGTMPADPQQGQITHQAWRIASAGLTTLQLIQPLQDQLTAQGFDILLACETEACGGFDFRFGTAVLPPPEMYVDLGDFRFVAARRGEAEAITILASRSPRAGFIQIITVGATATANTSAPEIRTHAPVVLTGDFAQTLEAQGHVVLADLRFETGSSTLSQGSFETLSALADYLAANPDRTVALVGHTDAEGSLDGNIALSRRRAIAVLDRLVADYGVNRAQLEAQGMGYLSPIASNLSEEGREANRRVEVIVTNTP